MREERLRRQPREVIIRPWKTNRAECKITDTILCHAGSKDQHHWYAAIAKLCQRLRSLYSGRCDWLSGETGSHWLAHEVELRSILSAASSSRNEVPRKLLKSVSGWGGLLGVIYGPLKSGFF